MARLNTFITLAIDEFIVTNNLRVEGAVRAGKLTNYDNNKTLSSQNIIWQFTASYFPHFGGLKDSRQQNIILKRVCANALITYDEL